jgi:enoyl-CoA hydratase/carnithine racemase
MAKQDLLYNKEDSIGIITLNRTEKLNALTHEMLHRINSVREPVFKGK